MFSVRQKIGLQAGQSSTQCLLFLSHAIVIAAVKLQLSSVLMCLDMQDLSWKRHCLDGSTCCFKTYMCLSAWMALSLCASFQFHRH